MKLARTSFVALAVLTLLAACSDDAPPPFEPVADARTRVEIGQGQVTGFVGETGALIWLGLPYAAPPVGDLRWRAPRPPEPFAAPLEALAHGERCPQVTNNLSSGEGFEPGQLIGSEDCLLLDIYAPGDALEQENLPVMMWIHGGGNTWGSIHAYDGSRLAQDQSVIIVAVQYRLGPLGFFSHPELRASAEHPDDAAANFALLDLIAALDWIEANIASFGGDPGNITVFGESAGAFNIAGLMASPLAHGKFHRAIMQSGGTTTISRELAETGGGRLANPALEAAERFAGPDAGADDLRRASLDQIYAVYRDDAGEFTALPRMIEDGVSLPLDGIVGAASRPDGFARVPVITGTNRDEMKLYLAFEPSLTRRLGPLVWLRDRERYDATAEYPSRNWRVNAVDDLLGHMHDAGHTGLWAYRFDWDEGGSVLMTDTGALLGASHGMEIPFVFNHFSLFGSFDSVLFNDRNAPGRAALSDAMGSYWAEFARTGQPGTGGGDLPLWQAWSPEGRLMRFDTPDDGGVGMIGGVDSMERILADLAADDRLSAAERCRVAAPLLARQAGQQADAGPLSDCAAGTGP